MPASTLNSEHESVRFFVALVGDGDRSWLWINRAREYLGASYFTCKPWILNVEVVLIDIRWSKATKAMLHLV